MYENLSLLDFLGKGVLNIFSDASIHKKAGCYGAIAVTDKYIVEEQYRVDTDATVNSAEIRGVRLAVLLALRHRHEFPKINIFSDSQLSIFGIRDRIFNWKEVDGKLYGYGNKSIVNQEVFIEIVKMITENSIYCSFWHQKSHVNINNYDSIKQAAHVFKASNSIRGILDYELIRYISEMNNIVDIKTRGVVKNVKKGDKPKTDPFTHKLPKNFDSDLVIYKNIQSGRKYGETRQETRTYY